MEEKVQILVQPDHQSMLCRKDQSILDSAIQNKIKIPVGCKGGGCGICKIQVLDGEADPGIYSKSVLSDEEVQKGFVLSCKATPKTNLSIKRGSL